MTEPEVRQDTALTINWLRVNAPTIMAIVGVGWYIGTGYTQVSTQLDAMKTENAKVQAQLAIMQNLPYRMDLAETAMRDTNSRVDALSNTIINQMDLIRRDVNRLTTQVEVLSSRVGLLTGDVDEPKQRRTRPGVDAAKD